MPGAAQETVYLVTTRYRVEYGDTGAARTFGREVSWMATRSLVASRGLSGIGTAFLGLAGSVAAAAGLGISALAAAGKVVSNVNTAMNDSLSMASQINLAFSFDQNPARNFERSLHASRDLMSKIYADAAKLPGEAQDFVAIARSVSGGVFAGGGDLDRLRQFTSRVALAAPAAGQSPQDAANQAMRALFGTASVGDNPLFAMLSGSRLLPGAKKFNEAPAAQRLDMLDAALSKLTDNPLFRSMVIDTLDVQLGTLADNLFGVNSAIGEVFGQSAYEAIVSGLKWVNAQLEESKPAIVESLTTISGTISAWADTLERTILDDIVWAALETAAYKISDVMDAFLWASDRAQAVSRLDWSDYLDDSQLAAHYKQNLAEVQAPRVRVPPIDPMTARQLAALGLAEAYGLPDLPPGSGAPTRKQPSPTLGTAPKVVQYNTIRVDYRGDDSPETVAVKLAKAMEKQERHPRRSRTMPAFTPRTTGLA